MDKKECWFKQIRSKNPNLKGYRLAEKTITYNEWGSIITTETYHKNWKGVDGIIQHVIVEDEDLTWWPKEENEIPDHK